MHSSSEPLVEPIKIKRKRELILNYQDFLLLNCKYFDPCFLTYCGVHDKETEEKGLQTLILIPEGLDMFM